jgi:hypothetical protein
MFAIVNVSRSLHIVFDDNGNITLNREEKSALEISAIIQAFITTKYEFINIKYAEPEVRLAAKQTVGWNDGEDAFIIKPSCAGGIGGNIRG